MPPIKWTSFFDAIYVLNLSKRTDRLIQITEHFEEYEVPFTRVEAIPNPKGAEGLRDTMLSVFAIAKQKDYDNILIFEDDALIVRDKIVFHDTMNQVVSQLNERYIMCFLGCQATAGFTHFHSPNLLPIQKGYSTHAVAYSKRGINEITGRDFGYPIDNWFVDNIQIIGDCYTVHPFLVSQRAGFSDIGHNNIDWGPFLEPRHEQKLNEMRQR
jgi:hypothetical protein